MKKNGKIFVSLALVFFLAFATLPIFSLATDKSEKNLLESSTKESTNQTKEQPTTKTKSSVTFKTKDISVNIDDDTFDLLNNVTAVDENNNEVEVKVKDDDGFDITQAKQYSIIYEAKHPETSELFTATRKVTVKEKVTFKTLGAKSPKALYPVTTEDELIQKIADSVSGDTIELSNDIVLTQTITLNKDNLTIDGKGHLLSLDDSNSQRHLSISNPATIKNITINGHGDKVGGGISSSSNITILNSLLKNNISDSIGGAVFSSGDLTIESSTLENNESKSYGGAIAANSNSINIKSNSIINNNRAKIGGGAVWHTGDTNGSINVSGSKIINNSTLDIKFTKGGGIGSEGNVNIVLNNAIVNSNKAVEGGGVYNSAGTITMTGGEISENKALYEGPTGTAYSRGGGILGKHVIINSGSINKNKINQVQAIGGGGIATFENGSVVMTGGEIKDNDFPDSSDGGGILAGKNNTVEISGNAVISGHKDNGYYTYGGGINGQSGTIITIKGSAIIKDNKAFMGGGVTVDDKGEINIKENAQIIKNSAYHGAGVAAEVVGTSGIKEPTKKANVNMSGGYVGENFGLENDHSHVAGVTGYEVNISGGKISNNYIPLGDDGAVSATKFNMTGGEISNNKIGKSFSNMGRARGAVGAVSVRMSGGSITNNIIEDLSGTPTYGGGLTVSLEENLPEFANPTVHITGGTIKGNTANYGGAIGVHGDMYDGSQNHKIIIENVTLEGNFATNYGGAVAFLGVDAHPYGNSRDNQLTLKNTKILDNKANYGGAIYSRSDFSEIIGGIIKENKALKTAGKGGFGGGIIANGKLEIKDETIIDNNKAEGSGGGIYTYSTFIDPSVGERINMPNALTLENGVKVINNKAEGIGGGIVANDSTIFDNTALKIKNGVVIENNESKTSAGGIMHNRVNAAIEDGVIINNNKAPYAGGISTSRSTLTITEQGRLNKITNNIANDPDENNGDGGGIWTGNLNNLNIKNTMFENNKAASGYFIKDNEDIEKCNNTVSPTQVSEPFEFAYNNFDVVYKKGTKLEYFTVNYDTDGGSVINSTKVIVNSLISDPGEPTKTGFDFIGWYKDSARTQMWDFTNDRVTSDITIYAAWKQQEAITYYDVNFDTRGGSPISSIKVAQNSLINRPADPALDGFRFVGWYTSPVLNNEWNFNQNRVTSNLTLYARWEQLPAPTRPEPTNPTNPPARREPPVAVEQAAEAVETAPLIEETPRAETNPVAPNIEEPENPQDTINEGDVPLGTRPFFDNACWIHWLMLLGIVITIGYTVVRLTKKHEDQEEVTHENN